MRLANVVPLRLKRRRPTTERKCRKYFSCLFFICKRNYGSRSEEISRKWSASDQATLRISSAFKADLSQQVQEKEEWRPARIGENSRGNTDQLVLPPYFVTTGKCCPIIIILLEDLELCWRKPPNFKASSVWPPNHHSLLLSLQI